jgi:class 3 adenylate cyclase
MTQTRNAPSRGLTLSTRSAGMERKHVAVLFADISGFTALVEAVDPELVYQVVRPLMDELVRRVHAHGGVIQQVLGDGFMAVFGLDDVGLDCEGLDGGPGHETRQAVRAGLALVSTAEGTVYPPVHVGIEYGEVLVTPSWEPAGFAVWGRPVPLASRLCGLAGPGAVQVGPAAFERAGRGFPAAPPIATRLKGFRTPILAYGVTAVA